MTRMFHEVLCYVTLLPGDEQVNKNEVRRVVNDGVKFVTKKGKEPINSKPKDFYYCYN